MRRRPGQFGPSPRNPTPRRGGSRVPPTGPEREEPEPLSDPRQITACTMYRTPPKTSSAPSPITIILVSRFIAATNAPTTTRRNTATEPRFKPKRLDSFLRNEDPSLRLQPALRTLLPSSFRPGAFYVKSQPLAFPDLVWIDARRLQRSDVEKHIRTAGVVCDETVATLGIPHFQGSCSHCAHFPLAFGRSTRSWEKMATRGRKAGKKRAIAPKRARSIRTPAVPRARTTSSDKDAHPSYSMMYRTAPLQAVH